MGQSPTTIKIKKKPMKVLPLILAVLLYTGCNSNQHAMKINTIEDIKIMSGKTVILQGVYVESKLAQKPAKEIHTGRYSLKINERLDVLLLPPYMPASIRPAEEVNRFKGKKVQIKGIVESRTYIDKPALDYQPQAVSIPSFVEISDIELMPEES